MVKARVFPDGTQRMSRGTRIIAKDGDLCYSLKEKKIDDYLYSKSIPHVKEARYPDSNMRADWEVMQNGKSQFVSLVIHLRVYQLFPERYTRDCYIACNLSRRSAHKREDGSLGEDGVSFYPLASDVSF